MQLDDEFSGDGKPKTPPGPLWSWPVPITGAFGADGRPVSFTCADNFGCQWGNYDKLSWLTLNSSVLPQLATPTVASVLQKFGASKIAGSPQHHSRPRQRFHRSFYRMCTTTIRPVSSPA